MTHILSSLTDKTKVALCLAITVAEVYHIQLEPYNLGDIYIYQKPTELAQNLQIVGGRGSLFQNETLSENLIFLTTSCVPVAVCDLILNSLTKHDRLF